LPILVGGAALTRKFTLTRILPAYAGSGRPIVAFARDAMKGLDLANAVMSQPETVLKQMEEEALSLSGAAGASEAMSGVLLPPVRSTQISVAEPALKPPDYERHEVQFRLSEIWPYLNSQMLLS
jgi:5-methyltetrahydrofolate--homocysteine methyltransferase